MPETIRRPQSPVIHPLRASELRRAVQEDDSPFGVQGLARDSLKILKPDCINALAATLALRGTPEQIRDPQFVAQLLNRREEWQTAFRVVHLVERSLWIDGHSDLVMTMVQNPSRILDNPPQEIIEAMSVAIAVHPKSTIWYGVPLFGDQTNAEGLPIPLTASEVRSEAERRIVAAQQQALQWRGVYRNAACICRLPGRIARLVGRSYQGVRQTGRNFVNYWKRVRRDARNRSRAKMLAQSEFYKTGRAVTVVPLPTTVVGRVTARTAGSLDSLSEMVSERVWFLESILPIPISPMTIMECDPFLFIELPHEPGRLRFLGHWYWQSSTKLHLHAPL